ncbi:MAG: hypothetical protein LUG21_04810 [Clostridiales bacterium]|nr:hypothetical protein [Clostridiales bacterium]
MADLKDTFLTYKGRPLVRCGNMLYYGNMTDPYVACLKVKSNKEFKDISLSETVSIQIISTNPDVSPKEKVIKSSEKQGLFNALDLGAVWLERELKK